MEEEEEERVEGREEEGARACVEGDGLEWRGWGGGEVCVGFFVGIWVVWGSCGDCDLTEGGFFTP